MARWRGRRRATWLICTLAACVLLLGTGTTGAKEQPDLLRPVRSELRGKLHELGRWCAGVKLFGTRYDIHAVIVDFWPEDAEARKGLGYEASDSGGWAKGPRKRPGNMRKGAMPELRVRQGRLADWYLVAARRAVEGHPRGLAKALVGRVIQEALLFAPEHAALRGSNGEILRERRGRKPTWILKETQASETRRPMLREAASNALARVPKPQVSAPRPIDEDSTVKWPHALQGKKARMLGLPPRDELARALVLAEATFDFYAAAFGRRAPSIPDLTLYSFMTMSRGNVFLAGQPHVKQSFLKFVAPLAALWIPNSNRVLIKASQREVRLEAAPRQVFSAFLRRHYGISGHQGWAVEGFALLLTWHLSGTRLLASVRQSKYGEKRDDVPDLSKRMRATNADWLAEGRALLASRDAPDIRLVLGKTVNTLVAEDVLYAYLLAMFLLEGRHEDLPGLLRDLAEGTPGEHDAIFGLHLGADVPTLDRRLRRWLEETKHLK